MESWGERSFWGHVPEDCIKAINELKRLKVYRLCGFDYEETFSDVWFLVLHEVDLYEEGEFTFEASRNMSGVGDPEAMNLRQAQAADRWLLRWKHLFEKYTNRKYYSEYYWKVHSGFDDYSNGNEYGYYGQVI